MPPKFTTALAVLATATLGLTPSALAAPPGGLGDLIGARGSSGEYQLGARGYVLAKSSGLTGYWWNSSSRTCARVVTYNGRYDVIDTASASDCGHGGGSDASAAIAAVAIVGLAAAIAAHNKKEHGDDRHDDEFERGYHDAMYGAPYDRHDSEGYHNGYMAGEAERNNRRASNSSYVRGAPPAAQAACARRGDEFLNVPPGSAVPVSVYNYGQGLYEVTVASGHYRARCSVDASGRVSDISPY